MPAKFRRFVTRTALQANCLCGQTFGKLRPDFRVIRTFLLTHIFAIFFF